MNKRQRKKRQKKVEKILSFYFQEHEQQFNKSIQDALVYGEGRLGFNVSTGKFYHIPIEKEVNE